MKYHLKTEGIITLAVMMGVLVFYSYITWKWYGKRRIKDIEPVSEIPKNISPMMAALADGIKDATEIVYIGMLSLIEKGFIKVEDSVFDIIFSNEPGYKKDGDQYVFNMEKIGDYGYRGRVLSKEEDEFLEILIEYNDGQLFKGREYTFENNTVILEKLKKRYQGKREEAFFIPNKEFILIFIFIMIFFNCLLFGLAGWEAIVSLSIFLLSFWVIFLNNIAYICFRNRMMPMKFIFLKIVIIAIMLVMTIAMCTFLISMIAVLGFPSIFVVSTVILFLFYLKNIGRYTKKGIEAKRHLEGLKKYIKSGESKKYDDIEEMIAYFKEIIPFSEALSIKKETISMMDKTIELSGFEKEKEYIDKEIAGLIYKNDKLKKLFGEKIFYKSIR
ncbi:hypothetical protein HMPREF1984_00475 [Leptotrichia sp. oral taxon 215 str. W9775]|uniref:DUF2207 family protein n=1 Tax=Leptotrichia sp. oral taxon 215 TaxID=712359 RepID=UPI0003ADC50E|nr:DUF2207 domain-containing protein [Leptotrichia sp. oral taxon 215]ERK68703.1 hypothetical protein HMPREF1984_00475 [Leptotrichia sp. oral taxon 215 str. W9775]